MGGALGLGFRGVEPQPGPVRHWAPGSCLLWSPGSVSQGVEGGGGQGGCFSPQAYAVAFTRLHGFPELLTNLRRRAESNWAVTAATWAPEPSCPTPQPSDSSGLQPATQELGRVTGGVRGRWGDCGKGWGWGARLDWRLHGCCPCVLWLSCVLGRSCPTLTCEHWGQKRTGDLTT